MISSLASKELHVSLIRNVHTKHTAITQPLGRLTHVIDQFGFTWNLECQDDAILALTDVDQGHVVLQLIQFVTESLTELVDVGTGQLRYVFSKRKLGKDPAFHWKCTYI